jgi:AcrR family transcriptional regulator
MSEEGERSGRERILIAAERLFNGQSYSDVTIARILEDAGIQAPSLYYHFGDKEGLYIAFCHRSLARLGERISAARNGSDLSSFLRSVARALVDPQAPDVFALRRDLRQLQRPEHRQLVYRLLDQAVYEPLMTRFLLARQAGELTSEPVDVLVQGFVALAVGHHPNYSMHTRDPEWVASMVAARFLHGFAR